MSYRHKSAESFSIEPETEYLITDVEELVNKNIFRYLDVQPFRVDVKDYTPDMSVARRKPQLPVGINRIDRDIVQPVAPGPSEFIGMDLLFSYPLMTSKDENPFNITLKWSNDIQVRLAVVDQRPIMLVEHIADTEHVMSASELSRETMMMYLKSIGLPESMWSNDFKDLMGDIYSSRDIKIKRQSSHLIDPSTTLEISHDARYMTNDLGDKELTQELCLNIDHYNEGREDGLYFPSTPTFRNMFRFDRSIDASQWQYRGAYAGKLVHGDFIDQLVQDNPTLGVPGSKLLSKAFTFLSEEQKTKRESL
jgi:hypothetical protein